MPAFMRSEEDKSNSVAVAKQVSIGNPTSRAEWRTFSAAAVSMDSSPRAERTGRRRFCSASRLSLLASAKRARRIPAAVVCSTGDTSFGTSRTSCGCSCLGSSASSRKAY